MWSNSCSRVQMLVICFYLTSKVNGTRKENVETRISVVYLNLPIPTIKLALIKIFKLVA